MFTGGSTVDLSLLPLPVCSVPSSRCSPGRPSSQSPLRTESFTVQGTPPPYTAQSCAALTCGNSGSGSPSPLPGQSTEDPATRCSGSPASGLSISASSGYVSPSSGYVSSSSGYLSCLSRESSTSPISSAAPRTTSPLARPLSPHAQHRGMGGDGKLRPATQWTLHAARGSDVTPTHGSDVTATGTVTSQLPVRCGVMRASLVIGWSML